MGPTQARKADIVLSHGRIITVDKQFRVVQAVAIADGRFVAVGTNEEVEQLIGSKTERVHLQGKVVVPGFVDGHAHMDREGLKFLRPSLTGKRSIREIIQVIEEEIKTKKPGQWVVTMPIGDYPYYLGTEDPGFLDEKRFPNRWDLDRVSPENPVYIRGIWYYWRKTFPIVSIANSCALKMAGITKDTPPPYKGVEIVKDEKTGEPNGIFLEWDQPDTVEFSLMSVVPRFTHAERVIALKKSMERYNAVGTTSVYEGHGISSETFRAYKELWETEGMTVRTYLVMSPAWDASTEGNIEEVLRDWATFASGKGFGDEMLKVGGVWVSVGDTPPSVIRRRARPYTAWAGYGVDQSLPLERGSLFDLVLAASKVDLRSNSIVGSREILEAYLDVFERVNQSVPIHEKRFVLQHLGYVSELQQEKIKRLGIVPTLIPSGTVWMAGSDRTRNASEQELRTFVPLMSFVEKGIPFALSSDNTALKPLHLLWVVVSRKDRATGKVIGPSQRLSREQALRALTIHGAYLTFEEHRKGSIEAGKYADLVVLSDDPMTCPEDGIQDIDVLSTMVAGDFVYEGGQ